MYFVQAHSLTTESVPETAELNEWAGQMDTRGFRSGSSDYALDKRCSPMASEFCIYFSTGDGFVTFKSWQQSMEKVTLDDSFSSTTYLAIAGLVAAGISALPFDSNSKWSGNDLTSGA